MCISMGHIQMSTLTTLQIDAALAEAIGYLPEHIQLEYDDVLVYVSEFDDDLCEFVDKWKVFSHQDPTVILPIIEMLLTSGKRIYHWQEKFVIYGGTANVVSGPDLRTAAALAVIELNKGK